MVSYEKDLEEQKEVFIEMYGEFVNELMKLDRQDRDEFLGRANTVLEEANFGDSIKDEEEFGELIEEVDSAELQKIIEFMIEEEVIFPCD